ncbi:hypothetical protein BLNAU_182 [Blattamonas nauphoetae]|uniref:Protein kinase domain-containing protein n=1 Tax=Blattamonas nauphoetae TaxID=2049346 RepID=A0ABQ9YMH3_9EUKA|nr:hypothetical protein BLNAU_182 [Blattamonas nauphoetae]
MLFSKPNIRDAFDVRSGRALHLAPELLDEPDLYRATPQSDVWAFGILLLESVLGLNPFSLMEGDRLRDGVRGLNLDVFFESLSPKHSKRASPNFRFLVTECLKQNPSERITFQSMKERQLIRSLLSLPEDIASFDATIARQNEHKRNSGEEWRPFGRLEVDMVGVGMCEIGFHPFLSRKGIIESVRIPPDFDKDSLLVVVDNPPLMNEWTMAEEPITPESHVVIYKNQHEYAMEHRKDQSYRLKQSLSKDKAEFYVMIQTGDIFKFPMEHTNDTVQSLFEEITKKFLYLPDERCLLTFRGKPLIRSYLLKEYGIAPGDRLNFTWRMLG